MTKAVQESVESVRAERGIQKRKPWLAFLLSFLVPGLGQLYTTSVGKAAAAFVLSFAPAFAFFFLPSLALDYGVTGLLGLVAASWSLHFLIALEAFFAAKKEQSLVKPAYDHWWVYLGLILFFQFGLPQIFPKSTLISALSKANGLRARTYYLPSGSMMPTLQPGDMVMADQRPRDDWRREDIVVFRESEDRPPIVKRIVGEPGDNIEIREGTLYLNGEAFKPSYWQEEFYDDFPVTEVPEGHFFTIGDNVNNSRDSRFIGPVAKESFLALVVYRIWGKETGTEFVSLENR